MRKTMVFVIAVLGLFVFTVTSPVVAKDENVSSKAQKKMTQTAEKATIEKININTADLDTLSHLKGIGPEETAQNIISHRTEVGAFEKIEDLKQIKGIGEKTFEQIRPLISLD